MKKQFMLCMLVMCLVSLNASARILARYSFDVSAADVSGNGNHGGLQNGAVAGVTDAERGLVLDLTAASNSRVYLIGTNTASDWMTDALVSQATVMMWAKFDSYGSTASLPLLFSKAWCFGMSRPGTNSFFAVQGYAAGWTDRADSNVDTADGEWHHYAATVDNTAGVMKIFIDGVEKDSASFTGPLSAYAYPCLIGEGLDGYIDDAILFDEALDSEEIQFYMLPKPIARYSFDVNGSDSSGNGHHAGLQNGAAIVMDAGRGKVLYVNGSGCSGAKIDDTNSWLGNTLAGSSTIMMWTKFDSWGTTGWVPNLFSKGNSYYLGRRNATNTWRWVVTQNDDGIPQAYYDSPDVADGEWHHVAGVTDLESGKVSIYIDGVMVGWQGDITDTLYQDTYAAWIGVDFDGQIDDLLIFDQALDAAKIQSYMAPEPLARYSFDTNAGDNSGNEHHGGLQYNAVAGVTDAERGKVLDLTASDNSRVYLVGTNSTSNWLQDALVSEATVMFWAKVNGFGSVAWKPCLFDKYSCALFRPGAEQYFKWSVETDSGFATANGVNTADNAWHHYAITIDDTAGVIKQFIDGVKVGSGAIPGTLTTSTYPAILGSSYTSGGSINGYMDDAIIFDKALVSGATDGSESGTINYYRVQDFTPPSSSLWLPSIFSDGMILQRNEDITIWGKASAYRLITVSLDSQQWQTTSDSTGRWSLTVPAQTGSYTSHTLSVTSGSETFSFSDVLFGDVWLCAGQSNMEWWLVDTSEIDDALASPDSNLRMFKVARVVSDTPVEDTQSEWLPATSAYVGSFSAVAYHFGSYLRGFVNVPVGLIVSAYGGTNIQCWTSREMLEQDFPSIVSSWEQELANYTGTPGAREDPYAVWNRLGGLYNGMICPVKPYTIKGYLWYQGEQNTSPALLVGPQEYRTLFPALINQWREDWGETVPFLFVQLPNFGATTAYDWAALRDAQNQALNLSDTSMAVTIDIGDPVNVHPDNKKEVGRRLCLEARNIIYGDNTVPRSPRVVGQEGFRLSGSSHARLIFSQTDEGLTIRSGSSVTGFQVAGTNGIFYSAQAEIESYGGYDVMVKVWSPSVSVPYKVRYAWGNDPVCNLIDDWNGGVSGFPVGTFEADIAQP